MASKEVWEVPYIAANAAHLIHVNVSDGAGGWDSRHIIVEELVGLVPASGISLATGDGRYLQKASNLSDLTSAAAARGNLSVYSIAQVDAAIAAAAASAGGKSMGRKLLTAMPALAGFTIDNANGATTRTVAEVAGKAIVVRETSASGGPKVAGFRGVIPTTGTRRTIAFVQQNASGRPYMGFCWGISNGVAHRVMANIGSSLEFHTYTNSNSRVSSGGIADVSVAPPNGVWLSVRKDVAGHVWYEMSGDGVNFEPVADEPDPGVAFTQVYFGIYTEAGTGMGGYTHSASFLSYDDSGVARAFD